MRGPRTPTLPPERLLTVYLAGLLISSCSSTPEFGAADGDVLGALVDARAASDAAPVTVPHRDGAVTDAGQDASEALADATVIDASIADGAIASQPQRLLYLADQNIDGVVELFVSSTDGATTASYQVNEPLAIGTDVLDFSTNGSGTMVLYAATTLEPAGATELFVANIGSVDTDGTPPGNPIRIHDDLPTQTGLASMGVIHAEWVPATDQIVFTAALQSAAQSELYLSTLGPTGWAAPLRLSGGLLQDLTVTDFAIAPDGASVLFRASQGAGTVHELYWIDLDSATPALAAKVSGPLANDNGDVAAREVGSAGYDWAADSSQFYYVADQNAVNTKELFVVRFSAGSPQEGIRVNGEVSWEGVDHVRWSPNSRWLAYVAREGLEFGTGLLLVDTLLPTLATGQLVGGSLYPEGSFMTNPPLWAPDSSGIAFHATQLETGGQTTELFHVGTSGLVPTAALRINGALSSGGRVPAGGSREQTMAWAPDSSYLVYLSEEAIANRLELFAGRSGSGGFEAPIRLSGPQSFAANQVTSNLTPISADASKVLFRSNKSIGVDELFVVEMSTSPPSPFAKVNAPLTLGGQVVFTAVEDRSFQWSPSGELVAYMADQEHASVVELFVVLVSNLQHSVLASAPLVSGGDILKFEWVR